MLLLQPQSTVSAAVRNKPTTTVLRMSSNSFDSSAIYVNLPKAKVCYIKNIKTSSKNLIAKNTHYYTTSSDDTYTDTFASIGLYAKKTGKYKVTYNICDKSGNKLSSGKVTVYVKNDLPVKSVKFAGKEVVKTMKNNSTLKLGEYAYYLLANNEILDTRLLQSRVDNLINNNVYGHIQGRQLSAYLMNTSQDMEECLNAILKDPDLNGKISTVSSKVFARLHAEKIMTGNS